MMMTTTMTTEGMLEETADGEGPVGDLLGWVTTREDLRIKEVY